MRKVKQEGRLSSAAAARWVNRLRTRSRTEQAHPGAASQGRAPHRRQLNNPLGNGLLSGSRLAFDCPLIGTQRGDGLGAAETSERTDMPKAFGGETSRRCDRQGVDDGTRPRYRGLSAQRRSSIGRVSHYRSSNSCARRLCPAFAATLSEVVTIKPSHYQTVNTVWAPSAAAGGRWHGTSVKNALARARQSK